MSTLEAAVPDIPPEDMPVAVPATEEREQYLGGRLLAEITDRLVLLIREGGLIQSTQHDRVLRRGWEGLWPGRGVGIGG